MTSRQNKIFEALKRAYTRARDVSKNEELLRITFQTYIDGANANILTSIEDIATLFFLGMFLYSEG